MRFVCADGEQQFRTALDVEPVRAQGHGLAWCDGRPADGE